jgi:hypothetical protein
VLAGGGILLRVCTAAAVHCTGLAVQQHLHMVQLGAGLGSFPLVRVCPTCGQHAWATLSCRWRSCLLLHQQQLGLWVQCGGLCFFFHMCRMWGFRGWIFCMAELCICCQQCMLCVSMPSDESDGVLCMSLALLYGACWARKAYSFPLYAS